MFMHIVTHLSGRLMALYTQVLASLKALLLKLVNNLRVRFTRVYQSVVSLLHPLAKTLSKIKALVASLTTQVLSIKQGLKLVVTTSGQIGQLLLTTVRQIRQHVAQAFKKDQ
jgi:hypothetical protein